MRRFCLLVLSVSFIALPLTGRCADAPGPLAQISITCSSNTITLGSTVTCTASGKDSKGNAVDITKDTAWASYPDTIASVDSTGNVKGLAAGSATIAVTSEGHLGIVTITVEAQAGAAPSANEAQSESCPPSSETVINNCLAITNYVALDKSQEAVDVNTGAMNYLRLGSLKDPCEADPKAAKPATLYNVIKLNGDQSAATSQWYVNEDKPGYGNGILSWSAADFYNPTRLYGIRKLQIVSIVLNASETVPLRVTYVIQSTKAQPTNVGDFLALLSVVGANSSASGAMQAQGEKPLEFPPNAIGCATVDTGFSTSSIQVAADISNGQKAKLSTSSQTITNEAKAWWDVSFALPIKKASALQYNSTANTVTATQINKQSLFATFDWYPFCTDLKASYSWSPAIFGGVSLASRPLDSILTGVSMHFSMASIYVGALLIKGQELKGLATGGTATPGQVSAATHYGFQPSFSVGIKLSIKDGAAQLTSKK